MSIKNPNSKLNLINNRIKYGTNGSIIVDSNALVVNAVTGRVGFDTTNPTSLLDISGSMKTSITDYSNSTGNNTQMMTYVNSQDLWSYPGYNFDATNIFSGFPNARSVVQNDVSFSVGSTTTFEKYFGGSMAPNGNLYFMPCPFAYNPAIHSSIWTQNIGIFNPYTKVFDQTTLSVNRYPDLSGKKLWGSITAPNGKIYCIPWECNFVPIIDPITNTIDTTSISTVSGPITYQYYRGGVLAPNGKIYCAGDGAKNPTIGVINTNNNTFYTIPVTLPGGYSWSLGFYNGALGKNGCVYFSPHGPKTPLKLNPSNDSLTWLSGADLGSHCGAVTGKDGNVYCMPFANNMTRIDVSNDTYSTVGGARPYQAGSGIVAQDGLIYLTPNQSSYTSLAAFDIDTNTYKIASNAFVNYFSPSDEQNPWLTSLLGPDGKIYFIPSRYNTISSIKTGIPTQQDWVFAPEFNKY